jgi:hypothetical protein
MLVKTTSETAEGNVRTAPGYSLERVTLSVPVAEVETFPNTRRCSSPATVEKPVIGGYATVVFVGPTNRATALVCEM